MRQIDEARHVRSCPWTIVHLRCLTWMKIIVVTSLAGICSWIIIEVEEFVCGVEMDMEMRNN